jgi:hypothetical protein
MKRRGIFLGFLITLVAVVLVAGPLGSPAPAQRSTQVSPPLRSLVNEFSPVLMPEATAYSVFTTDANTPHQVWYRISGGDALFRQRLRVFTENAPPRPMNQLPPQSELQHEITTNAPTGWFNFPVQRGVVTYYFDGDNRVSPNSPWRDAFGLKVTRRRYGNGYAFHLGFEDQEILDDYNDLEIEVVIIQPAF